MSYAEKMTGPSQPETGHIHQPNIATREDRIQAKVAENKELHKLLGPVGAERTIAEREAAFDEDKAELTQKAELHGKDSLTGLYDRGRFNEEMDREISRANRHDQAISAIFLDVNNLKFVNDRYGHPAGDKIIKAVATVLSTELRATDLAGRYGGDEFEALLPQTGKAPAAEVALRLLEILKTLEIEVAEGHRVKVSVAIGIDTLKPEQKRSQTRVPAQSDGERLIQEADRAMYASKKRGDDKVVVAIDSEAEKFEIGEFLKQKGLNIADVVPVNRRQLPKATSLPKLPA